LIEAWLVSLIAAVRPCEWVGHGWAVNVVAALTRTGRRRHMRRGLAKLATVGASSATTVLVDVTSGDPKAAW